MPIYMDRHYIEGATKHAIAHAHEKDQQIQDQYGVRFLTYWFDESRCTAFCLVDAPDKEAIQVVHNKAHGEVPHEIIEVDPSVVEAFLGRIKDPVPAGSISMEESFDSAFRAIMFTDLKDSTLMTTLHGDTKALHMLHICNLITRNALKEFQGNEVKHTGDGIMASFVSVPKSIECARAIQRSLAAHNRKNPVEALYLRIGIGAGEPIEEHGDLFGSAVQQAARICDLSEPGQILVTEEVWDTCNPKSLPFIDIGKITLKGFKDPIRAYRVEWESSR